MNRYRSATFIGSPADLSRPRSKSHPASGAAPTDTFCVLIEQPTSGRGIVPSPGATIAEGVGQAIIGAVMESLFIDAAGQPVEAACYSAWSAGSLKFGAFGAVPCIKMVYGGCAPPKPLTLLAFDRRRIHALENPWVLANDMADRIGGVIEGTAYFKARPGNMLHDTYTSGTSMISHLELLGRIAHTAEQMRRPKSGGELAAEITRLGDVAAFSVTGYSGGNPGRVPRLDFVPKRPVAM